MPRTCTICRHVEREAIDAALIERHSFRSIADQFGVSKTSLIRHSDDHLPAMLVEAKAAADVAHADTILAQVQSLRDRALKVLDTVEEDKDWRIALGAIREARACIELLGKLAGELQDGATVNVFVSPEWQTVQTAILDALAPHPDARLAVAAALQDIPTHHAPGHA